MTEADLTHYTDAGHDSIVGKVPVDAVRRALHATRPERHADVARGSRGGAEWGGAAYDPSTTVLFVKSNDSPEIQSMKKVDTEQEAKDQTVYDQGKRCI